MIRLIGLAGTITISFSAIFVRFADVAPTTAAFFRVGYAVPVLFLIHRFVSDGRSRRQRLMAFGAGAFFAADLISWHLSIRYIGAGLSTVVANSQVLWVGILAWILLGEKPTRASFAVVPLMLIGITLIGGLGRDDAYGVNPGLGAVLALVAGLCYAGFLMMLRSSNRGMAHPSGPLLDASFSASLILLVVSPLDSGFDLAFSWPAHGWLLALGVVIQVGGWIMITATLPRLPALETSVMLLLQPALTVIWAGIIFTEDLSWVQWSGVVLVMGGILASALAGAAQIRRAGEARAPAG